MGNKVTLGRSDDHVASWRRDRPPRWARGTILSAELGQEVTETSVEDQDYVYVETQPGHERRKAEEVRAKQERELACKARQEEERLWLEAEARPSRQQEERRKATEALARDKGEQVYRAYQEKERLQLEKETRRAREQVEEWCKAAEACARQEWEQAHIAHQEEERLRQEAEARRARHQEEERRKAAEARARQEREQAYIAHLEEERLRLEAEARRARQQEEERRTAEARARQEREQAYMAHQAEERLRLEAEARRARQQEEERRKAASAEARARQEREQAYMAHQAEERLRLEAEAGRARQQEDERRKAAEARASQEQERELKVMLRKGIQLQKEAMSQSVIMILPEVCRRHNTRQGCTDPNCRRLHICRLFLAEICKHGVTCRNVHSLTTVHNQMVCGLYKVDTIRELSLLQQLRRAFDENDKIPENQYLNNLERCYKFSTRSSCDQIECNRIHICREYVSGACWRVACKFGHDLHTTHNNGVLSRHRVTKMSGKEILEILRVKEIGGTQKADGAAAATSSARNGAVPRQRSHGTGSQPSQKSRAGNSKVPEPSPAGLSDELQCPVCLELFSAATTLGCGHTFCAECLREVRDRSGDRCPLCRAHISSVTRSVTLDNIVRSMSDKQ